MGAAQKQLKQMKHNGGVAAARFPFEATNQPRGAKPCQRHPDKE
jgi:hypothetical protein